MNRTKLVGLIGGVVALGTVAANTTAVAGPTRHHPHSTCDGFGPLEPQQINALRWMKMSGVPVRPCDHPWVPAYLRGGVHMVGKCNHMPFTGYGIRGEADMDEWRRGFAEAGVACAIIDAKWGYRF
jgi:hypothetical protein